MTDRGRPKNILAERQRIILDLPPELVRALDLVAEQGRSDYLITLLAAQKEIQAVLNHTMPLAFYDLAGVPVDGRSPYPTWFVPTGETTGLSYRPTLSVHIGYDAATASVFGTRRYWVAACGWNADTQQWSDPIAEDALGPFESLRDVERHLTKHADWGWDNITAWMPL